MSLGNKEIMAQNIRRFLDMKGLNPRQLSIALDFKYTTVLDWVNAKTYPRIDKIEIMANYFGVEKSDLVELYDPTQAPSPTLTEATDKLVQLTPERQERVLEVATRELEEQLKGLETNIEEDSDPVELYEVTTVTKLAAGYGYSFDDNDYETKYVENEPPRHDLASIVDGDSMLPDYEDGDIVYLRDAGFSRYNGQVCAIAIDDQTYIKKVYTEPKGLRLVSINKDYPDRFVGFPPDEGTHIKIFLVIGSDTPVNK